MLRQLSDAGFSVAGIEAGGNHDTDPLIYDATNAGSLEEEFTYKFFYEQTTEANPDMGGKVLNYTTGRMVGGGTSINGMQYVRSSDRFWNEVAAINGGEWNASQVAQDYKSLEQFVGVSGAYVSSVHGVGGKMAIRQAPVTPSQMAVDLANALSLVSGKPVIDDYNNPLTPVGAFTRWSLFQKPNGNRASSSNDFLSEVIDENGNPRAKCNVRVHQNATVSRVLFSNQVGGCQKGACATNAAHGVEYIQYGQTKQLFCRKEIILCAGIHSNEILQRSGVGPKALLASLGIPLIFDNASVGSNSQNHLINTAVFSAPPAASNTTDVNALYTAGAFLPTPVNTPNPAGDVRGFQWIGVDAGNGTLVVVFYNLNPKSRGTDRLQDRDPLRVTDVAEHLLSESQDLTDIVNVFKQQITALHTALNSIDAAYGLMEPSLATIADDDLLKDYIIDNIEHSHHWSGTCKMAPLDQGGVVDAHGKVFGTRKLRVADISVSPIQPDGNTAAAAFLVGYKIAKFIIEEHKRGACAPRCGCSSACKCGCQSGDPCQCNSVK